MARKLKTILYSALPVLMIILCASMITYIFAATKSELRIEGQIGYERPKGTGTEEDPFLIYNVGANDGTAKQGSFNYYAGNNASGINYFSSSSPQYYFKQVNDISGSNFTQTVLLGFYDGNDYKFDASGSNQAIFSAVGSTDVTTSKLYDLDVYNKNSTASAGVVTNLYGTLDGVTFDGSITSSGAAAGLVGTTYLTANIANCVNNGSIFGATDAAGITNSVYSGVATIENCVNNGNIKSSKSSAGIVSLVILSQSITITDCVNYGKIIANNASAGICGVLTSTTATISNCHNYGEITNSSEFADPTLSYTSTSGGYVAFGGIVAGIQPATGDIHSIEQCSNNGKVHQQAFTTASYVGGIFGVVFNLTYADTKFRLIYCYNTGEITSAGTLANIGGLGGYLMVPTYVFPNHGVVHSYNSGRIGTGANVGGLLGGGQNFLLENAYNIGQIVAGTTTGALAGTANVGFTNAYYLHTCGASQAVGSDATIGTNSSKSMSQLQTQSTYSGWTFGTYGTATDGWVFVPAEILVDGEIQKLVLPRLWCEDLEVLNTYSITLKPNGATSGTDTTVQIVAGESITLVNPGFRLTTKKVSGWATSASGSVVYEVTENFVPTSNMTLYAIWVQNGTGTKSDPYGIYTLADFNTYAGVTTTTGVGFGNNNLYFKQMADITSSSFTQVALNAHYDGGGYTFNTTGSNKALFTYIGSSTTYATASLSNLIVKNNSSTALSGIATYLYGTIDGCGFEGSITNATASAYVGGLVSRAYSGAVIKNSYNAANITTSGSSTRVGGILGYCASVAVTITSCYNTGNITGGTSSYAGGIVGYAYGSSTSVKVTITYCYNAGTIYGKTYNGGLVGYGAYSTISYSYNIGTVNTGSSYEGAIIGYAYSTTNTITYDYWLSTCGPTYYYGSGASSTATGTTSKTLANMQVQTQYSNWTFGTAGTATSGWVWGAGKSIVVNGTTQSYSLPRCWFEYEVIRVTYTISYNANGGTGTMANQSVTSGSSIKLTSNSFTPPSGKVFSGWATSSTGSVVYSNGATIKPTSNLTLYAVWADGTACTICGGDGVCTGYNVTSQVSGSGPCPAGCGGTYTNYALICCCDYAQHGIGTSCTTSGCPYAGQGGLESHTCGRCGGSGIVTGGSGSTTTYTITYNANGGSGTMTRQLVPSGSSIKLTSNSFTPPSGKSFSGWATSSTGSVIYSNGATITPTANLTLYAVWADGTACTICGGDGVCTGYNVTSQLSGSGSCPAGCGGTYSIVTLYCGCDGASHGTGTSCTTSGCPYGGQGGLQSHNCGRCGGVGKI